MLFNFIRKQKELAEYEKLMEKNKSILPSEYDTLLYEVTAFVIERGSASNGVLQHKFNISFSRAEIILQQLETIGIIGKENGVYPREILVVDKHEAMKCISNFCNRTYTESKLIDNFDSMEGHEFEYFCAELLRKNGFVNVEVTRASADHGIDVLAEKDDITYAIQCKCYSSNIGNSAVQEAHTGKSLYHRDVAVVMTNRYFTEQAKSEAKALGVKLWDRDKIEQLVKS